MRNRGNDGAVFFVRHYNDVDHMAPVAWRCALDLPVRVVVTDEAAERHPLIDVFDSAGDIEIVRLRSYAGTVTDLEARAALEARSFDPSPLLDGVGERPAVCLDWDYQDAARRIAETAGERDLVTISLPHGDAPYVNLLINLEDLDGDLARSYEQAAIYDHTVVPNSVCAVRYKALPPGRLHILGSPRYCQAWTRRLPSLVGTGDPSTAAPDAQEELRVAVFLRNANFPIHWEEFVKALELILDSGPCTIVLKHHTRDKRMQDLLQRFPILAEGTERIEISPDTEGSTSLLDRVDLVVDLGTSIAFEAVLRGMPVIELEHVHPNRSTVAEYLPRSEVRTRDELVAAMAATHEDRSALVATREEADRFRVAIVEPAGPQVLDRYLDLIESAEPTAKRS